MGKGMLLYEEDPLGGEGAGAAAEGGATGGDPLAGEGGAGGGAAAEGTEGAEGAEGGDPLAGEGAADEGKGGKATAAAAPDTGALAQVLEKLNATLTARPGMTPEQQEQMWQQLEAESGLSRQTIQWQQKQLHQTAVLVNLDTNRELGKMKAEKIVDDPEVLKEVEKQMAALPPAVQANPKAWEDAAYMALGRASRVKPKVTKDGGAPAAGGNNGGQRRIVGGATGTAGQTRGTAAGKPAVKKEYPAFEQHIINRQFNGNAEEYEKYKGKSSIDNDVRITAGQGAGAADMELQRLTRDNT